MKDLALDFIFSGWGSTILVTALGAFGYKKYTRFTKELMDIPRKWRSITDPKSDGGKKVTEKEKDEFIKEIVDVIQRIPFLFGRGV